MQSSNSKFESQNSRAIDGVAFLGCLHELARGVAHGLNGALNTLALDVELLGAGAGTGRAPLEGGGGERWIASARVAVREMQEIVQHQLLPFGRSAGPESIPVAELMSTFRQELTPILHLRRAEFDHDAAASFPSVHCRADDVRRLWLVTARTVLDALPPPGSLRFALDSSPAEVFFILCPGADGALSASERGAVLERLASELPGMPAAFRSLGGTILTLGAGPGVLRFGLPRG